MKLFFLPALSALLLWSCSQSASPDTAASNSAPSETSTDETLVLFDGQSLEDWKATGNEEAFTIQDGLLYCKGSGGGLIYYAPGKFGDFELEGEVKLSEDANSGVFFRLTDLSNVVQTGIEMQVLDSYGKENPDKHDFGAIYDIKEPSTNAARPAGEWNNFRIRAVGPQIEVHLNGQKVMDLDLSHWTEAGQNPDGTANKFDRPYASMTEAGYIGFQDHGDPVWYRNIRLTPISSK